MRLKLVSWINVHDFLFGYDLSRQSYGHHYREGLYDLIGKHNLQTFTAFKFELEMLLNNYGFDGITHSVVACNDPSCTQTFELPADDVVGLWFEREREIASEQQLEKSCVPVATR